ncbi:hypothetical protein NDU88_004543 [Pleurodeles waltl]|uniref:Uncharacterized protein n=1 Tax=Pleurodeles waltl TaxID=8319 RepID=A0AAV7RIG3_PLEWA|nr:hypothetical protein NDU88_004543 [Pleurodeles waltl]
MRFANGLAPLAARPPYPLGLCPHRNPLLPPAAGRRFVVRGGHLLESGLGLHSGGVLGPFLPLHLFSQGVARPHPPSCASTAVEKTAVFRSLSLLFSASVGF